MNMMLSGLAATTHSSYIGDSYKEILDVSTYNLHDEILFWSNQLEIARHALSQLSPYSSYQVDRFRCESVVEIATARLEALWQKESDVHSLLPFGFRECVRDLWGSEIARSYFSGTSGNELHPEDPFIYALRILIASHLEHFFFSSIDDDLGRAIGDEFFCANHPFTFRFYNYVTSSKTAQEAIGHMELGLRKCHGLSSTRSFDREEILLSVRRSRLYYEECVTPLSL